MSATQPVVVVVAVDEKAPSRSAGAASVSVAVVRPLDSPEVLFPCEREATAAWMERKKAQAATKRAAEATEPSTSLHEAAARRDRRYSSRMGTDFLMTEGAGTATWIPCPHATKEFSISAP